MQSRRSIVVSIAVAAVFCSAHPVLGQNKSIVVASTTSTEDSGLFEYLLPLYKQKTGVTVKVIAQGDRPSARHRPAWGRGRRVRPCQIGGADIPVGRSGPEALSGDVPTISF